MNKFDKSLGRTLELGKTLHLYADGTSGSDANDGLSELKPKKSLALILAEIPKYIEGRCLVHLRGTFDLGSTSGTTNTGTLSSYVGGQGVLILEGGLDFTEVLAAQTADISSTTTIGLSTLSLTPDQYVGYWLEILDGSRAGEVRTIFSHTATTYVVSEAFSGNPGNVNFRIVKPSTVIYTAGFGNLVVACTGKGLVSVQGLRFEGQAKLLLEGGSVYLSALFLEGLAARIEASSLSYLELGTTWFIPHASGPGSSINSKYKIGISNRKPVLSPAITFTGILYLWIRNSVFLHQVVISSCLLVGPGQSRFTELQISGSIPFAAGYTFYSGVPLTRIENITGIGLLLKNSSIEIQAGSLLVQNCGSHGIKALDSTIEFLGVGVAGGAGNTGAGIYATRSLVTINAATPPTLTGAIGDISVDGATSVSSWGAVAAGTPVTDLTTFTTVKAA